jgi:GntR family transcriptional regulator/MocR family aminotransferase
MRVNPAIKLDHNSRMPVFEQLARELETSIQSGTLGPGQMLPSTREFAASLLLARGTVVRAYEQLIDKGLVRAVKGKGLFVAAPNASKFPKASAKLQKLQPLSDVWTGDNCAPSSDLQSQDAPNHAPLAVEDVTKAAVPQALLPVKRWRELIMKHCKQLGRTYEFDDFGALDLRQAACRFLRAAKGVSCSPEQISVYTNTDQALDTIARLLIKPGDTACDCQRYR